MKTTIFARLYHWAAERLYRDWAVIYDAVSWFVSLGRWSRWRSQVIPHIQGGRILEVGFGTGELLLELKSKGFEAVGLDVSFPMHRITRKKYNRKGVLPVVVLGKTQEMPFLTESFDCIVSTFPAGYITEISTFMEFNRVLVNSGKNGPGGKAGKVIVVGVYSNFTSNLAQKFHQVLFGKPEISAAALFTEMAAESGFLLKIKEQNDDKINLPVFVFEKIHHL